MRKSAIASSLFLLIQLSVGASAFSVAAQDPDGRILSTKPRAPLPSYESLDEFGRGYFPRAVYDEARAQTGFDILEITYASDGQAVRGVLIRPKAPGAKKWPAIIFNRGGNGQLGSLMDNGLPCVGMNTSCLDVADLYQFAVLGQPLTAQATVADEQHPMIAQIAVCDASRRGGGNRCAASRAAR